MIDKANGGKADAINAGLNAARHDLVCVIDADSLLEELALARGVLPFIEDPPPWRWAASSVSSTAARLTPAG